MICFRYVYGFLAVMLLAACEDERQVKRDLMADCENHYQATSYKVALKTCEKAAEQDIPLALWLLGNIHEYDLAKQGASSEKAFEWYLKAAEADYTPAQTLVGEYYLYGIGVDVDYDAAYRWFKKAVAKQDADAIFAMGNLFLNGWGRPVDESIAISWFRQSASQNHMMSINNLAWIYATTPNDTIRSGKKANFWAEKLLIESPNQATFLDTRAAVYAQLGQFDKALELQNQAMSYLPEDTEESTLLEFQKHLESYQQQKPWREPANGQ